MKLLKRIIDDKVFYVYDQFESEFNGGIYSQRVHLSQCVVDIKTNTLIKCRTRLCDIIDFYMNNQNMKGDPQP